MEMSNEEIFEKAKKFGLLAELEVTEIFRKNGFRLEISKYYNDIDDGKGREIDLVADYTRKTDTEEEDYLEMVFKFVVEVKTSKNNWVFSSSFPDSLYEDGNVFFRYESENFSKENLIDAFVKYIGRIPSDQRLGHSFSIVGHEVKNKDDSAIVSALSSVSKAFYEEFFEESYIHSHSQDLSEKIFEYYELIVVIDAPIYEVYIDSGTPQVENVKDILTAFYYKSPRYSETSQYFVRIISKDYLDEFLKNRIEKFNKISEDILKIESDGRVFQESD